MKEYREYLQDAKRLYDKLGYAAPETHVDRIAEALRSAASHTIPMPQHELDALIQRNEERKRVKATITTPRWFVDPDGDISAEDGTLICMFRDPGGYNYNPPEESASPIVYARNDTPEDDIDQLLALIADLQSALQDT